MQKSRVLPQNKAPHLPVFPLVPLRQREGARLIGDSSQSLPPTSVPPVQKLEPPSQPAPMNDFLKRAWRPGDCSDVSWTSRLSDTSPTAVTFSRADTAKEGQH